MINNELKELNDKKDNIKLKGNPNLIVNKDGTVDIIEPYVENNENLSDTIIQSRLMDQYHDEAIKNGVLPSSDIYTENEVIVLNFYYRVMMIIMI